MTEQPIVIANWKLGLDFEESKVLLNMIANAEEELVQHASVVICPPAMSLQTASEAFSDGSKISFGIQNIYFEEKGPFTGENSILTAKQLGAEYVIVGHSERRKYFNEKNEDVARKTKLVLKHDLIPIVCIGETYEERQSQRAELVVTTELEEALSQIEPSTKQRIIIAYEPIWAIGTGQAINPRQAEMMGMVIHQKIVDMFPEDVISNFRVVYGGSVDSENIKPFVDGRVINGVLVGGASQNFQQFNALVHALDNE